MHVHEIKQKTQKCLYINIINWKTGNCQIGAHAQAPAGGGACAWPVPIAGDANEAVTNHRRHDFTNPPKLQTLFESEGRGIRQR